MKGRETFRGQSPLSSESDRVGNGTRCFITGAHRSRDEVLPRRRAGAAVGVDAVLLEDVGDRAAGDLPGAELAYIAEDAGVSPVGILYGDAEDEGAKCFSDARPAGLLCAERAAGFLFHPSLEGPVSTDDSPESTINEALLIEPGSRGHVRGLESRPTTGSACLSTSPR